MNYTDCRLMYDDHWLIDARHQSYRTKRALLSSDPSKLMPLADNPGTAVYAWIFLWWVMWIPQLNWWIKSRRIQRQYLLHRDHRRTMNWKGLHGDALAEAIDLEELRKLPMFLWSVRHIIDAYATNPDVQLALDLLDKDGVRAELGFEFAKRFKELAKPYAEQIKAIQQRRQQKADELAQTEQAQRLSAEAARLETQQIEVAQQAFLEQSNIDLARKFLTDGQ